MTDRPVRVCDHALVRFLERVGGLDVEGVRRHLAESLDRAVVAAETIGSREVVVVAEGIKYVVVKGRLVTVLDEKMNPKRSKGRNR